MSLSRQVLFSAVLVAVGVAAWFAFDRAYLSSDAAVSEPGAPTAGAERRRGGQGGQGRPGGFGGGATLVVTAEVGLDDTGLELRTIGTAEAARAVTIFAEVTGVVEEVTFASGAGVETGDILLRLAAEDEPDVPALQGWRRDIFGADALALKAGRLALAHGPDGICLIPVNSGTDN